tara:strand:- start:231 stop:1286 length:1056 start_codon:yes stop_codon:yes gene_type:complete
MAGLIDPPKTTDPLELLEYFQDIRDAELNKKSNDTGIFTKEDEDSSGIMQFFSDWWNDTERKVEEAREELRISLQDMPMPEMPTVDMTTDALPTITLESEPIIETVADKPIEPNSLIKEIISNQSAIRSSKGLMAPPVDKEIINESVSDVVSDTPAVEVQPPDGKDPFNPNSFTQKHLEKVEAGGYNTLFGNAEKTSKEFKDVKITDMSIGELVEFTKPSGPYGKWVKPRLPEDTEAYQRGLTSTPLGKYQIVGTTLRKLVKDYEWSLEDKFTKKVQDKMFLQLAYEALDNKESMGEKVKSMRKVWEGLREGKGSTEQDVIKIIKEIESTRLSRSPFPRRKPAGAMERPPL